MGRAVGTVHSEHLSFLGVISLSWSLSGKANTLVQLVISAEDGGGLQAQPNARVNISIVEGTVSPPVFEQAQYFFTVPEDTLQGATVGAVRAQNPPGTALPFPMQLFSLSLRCLKAEILHFLREQHHPGSSVHMQMHAHVNAHPVSLSCSACSHTCSCVYTRVPTHLTYSAHCCCTPLEQSLPQTALSCSSTPFSGPKARFTNNCCFHCLACRSHR